MGVLASDINRAYSDSASIFNIADYLVTAKLLG
jgi:hypothetical protein